MRVVAADLLDPSLTPAAEASASCTTRALDAGRRVEFVERDLWSARKFTIPI
jgi:hypothetical protein